MGAKSWRETCFSLCVIDYVECCLKMDAFNALISVDPELDVSAVQQGIEC